MSTKDIAPGYIANKWDVEQYVFVGYLPHYPLFWRLAQYIHNPKSYNNK